ncbi:MULTISPECIES: hypothetical protein [Thalassospira]|nr:hypothetical protein [Thalassospira sp. GB04J01]
MIHRDTFSRSPARSSSRGDAVHRKRNATQSGGRENVPFRSRKHTIGGRQ